MSVVPYLTFLIVPPLTVTVAFVELSGRVIVYSLLAVAGTLFAKRYISNFILSAGGGGNKFIFH